jgi:hypothetical protein
VPEGSDEKRNSRRRVRVGRLEDVQIIARTEHGVVGGPFYTGAFLANALFDFLVEIRDRSETGQRFWRKPRQYL